jgi:hypothetical protein
MLQKIYQSYEQITKEGVNKFDIQTQNLTKSIFGTVYENQNQNQNSCFFLSFSLSNCFKYSKTACNLCCVFIF